MSNKVVELKSERERWNQRWRTDRLFKPDFDYEKPEYANCPDDLRWALPLFENQRKPEFKKWIGYYEALAEQKTALRKKVSALPQCSSSLRKP